MPLYKLIKKSQYKMSLITKLRDCAITGTALVGLVGMSDYSYAEEPVVKQEQVQYSFQDFKKVFGERYEFFTKEQKESLENNWPRLKKEYKKDIYTIYADNDKFREGLSEIKKESHDYFEKSVRKFTDKKAENAKKKYGHIFPGTEDIREIDSASMSMLWYSLDKRLERELEKIGAPWFRDIWGGESRSR